jgi:hypothetical protein
MKILIGYISTNFKRIGLKKNSVEATALGNHALIWMPFVYVLYFIQLFYTL